jgi:primosomal protein N' (replication factor Y)
MLPLPLDKPYDYELPPGLIARRGMLVRAPVGARHVLGVVWGEGSGEVAADRLKRVEAVMPGRLPESLCDFIDWVAQYTLAPAGAVLAQALRVQDLFDEKAQKQALVLGTAPSAATSARNRVTTLMNDGKARSITEIAQSARVSPGVIRGMTANGALVRAAVPDEPCPEPDHSFDAVKLTPDQLRASEHMREAVKKREFSVALLDGVTGSGKTEAYFEAVAAAIAERRQALILLPEIALTVQFLDRFAARFGCRPVEWHSGLSPAVRKRAWRQVLNGEARVVAGARSALFLPFPKLGLIVVDEEHDQAYKQEEGVIYHARDMAVVRARFENCPIILASATPSLESFANARGGRYEWLKLTHRHGMAQLPEVRLVDLRESHGEPGQYLSPPLREALGKAFSAGEQSLLFLNRRGYAPLTVCTVCGHKESCRNCSAWLVEHRRHDRLVCHHCGQMRAIPKSCAACAAEDSLIACGPGVERVEEELRTVLPDARVAIASSDTLQDAAKAREFIRAFSAGEIDVLIGTQIVAKGHHFPNLTLAGVVDGDLGSGAGDPRAAERTFQLLHQVAGRSGRESKPGLVLIQTRNPADPVMQALAAGSRDSFLEEEIALRERGMMPPFGRLVSLILAGRDGELVRSIGRKLAATAPKASGLAVWGPAPAFYQVLRGRSRERLLVHAAKNINVQAYLRTWLKEVEIPRSLRLSIDVDPISFY